MAKLRNIAKAMRISREVKQLNSITLGRSNVKISPVIMGTWQAGKKGWTGVEDDEVVNAIRAGYEAGLTTVDTAEVYGNGYSEKLVAKALSDVRNSVTYATKVFANHLAADKLVKACEDSLERLQTDRIDLYQIHWPAGSFDSDIVPIEETMGALVKLKEAGKIRAIGVSNFSKAQLEEALQYGRIDSIQPPYSLFWRQVEKEIMPFCEKENISILAYSSLAQGLLTGKFGPEHEFSADDIRSKNKLFKGETYQAAQKALDELRPIAQKYETSLACLAIAWLIDQPQTCAIVGARNAEQAKENAKAKNLQLSTEDVEKIDKIGRSVTDRLDENPVMWNF